MDELIHDRVHPPMRTTLAETDEHAGNSGIERWPCQRYERYRASMVCNQRSAGLLFGGLRHFARISTCPWTLVLAAAFMAPAVVSSGLIYWRTAVYIVSENHALLAKQRHVLAALTTAQ
jgi:hypothetical protein